MQTFNVKDHEPSLLPEGNWKLVWADEFDGTELDRTKWLFRLDFWGERNPAYTDQGVVLDGNSHIELHRTVEDGRYVSPQLQTGSNSFDIPKTKAVNPWGEANSFWPLGDLPKPTFMHRYGYYECRCKFQKYPEEMWSAFWTQAPGIGTTYGDEWSGVESDIMECFFAGKATTGNIMGGYADKLREEARVRYDLPETEDGWHRFGMDWSPDGYVFYCDGQKVSETHETVSRVPQFILLTTEIQGYRNNKPLFCEGEYVDDAFIADYVRVFDRAEGYRDE